MSNMQLLLTLLPTGEEILSSGYMFVLSLRVCIAYNKYQCVCQLIEAKGWLWYCGGRETVYAGQCILQRRRTWTGDFKCREVKTGLYRNRSMQTGSAGTLIGWKSGQTTFVPLWDWMEGAWLRTQFTAGGYKEMSSICADPRNTSPNEGGGGGGSWGVSANEYSCAHHVTWSPNKLWRSIFIFNL